VNTTIDRKTAHEHITALTAGPHPLWHDIPHSERRRDPTTYVRFMIDKLVLDPMLRRRALDAMKEVRSRCIMRDGAQSYAYARRDELPADYLDRVHAFMPGLKDKPQLSSALEFVPRLAGEARESWLDRASLRWQHAQDWTRLAPGYGLPSASDLFGLDEFAHAHHFWVPVMVMIENHMLHSPMTADMMRMGQLACAAAANVDPEATERVCSYLIYAAKTPPLIVRNLKAKTASLVLICAD
jgi:hypothetical protein